MPAKPTTGQTVEIEGIRGSFKIKRINRTQTRMVLINDRGGEGAAILRRDGEWRVDTVVISNQRRVIFGEV